MIFFVTLRLESFEFTRFYGLNSAWALVSLSTTSLNVDFSKSSLKLKKNLSTFPSPKLASTAKPSHLTPWTTRSYDVSSSCKTKYSSAL
jgi:hypothetical protein